MGMTEFSSREDLVAAASEAIAVNVTALPPTPLDAVRSACTRLCVCASVTDRRLFIHVTYTATLTSIHYPHRATRLCIPTLSLCICPEHGRFSPARPEHHFHRWVLGHRYGASPALRPYPPYKCIAFPLLWRSGTSCRQPAARGGAGKVVVWRAQCLFPPGQLASLVRAAMLLRFL